MSQTSEPEDSTYEVEQESSRLRSVRSLVSKLFQPRSAKLGGSIIVAIFALVLIGSVLIPYSPYRIVGALNSPPSYAHPFGTDYLGHDILSQVVWGAYPSLFVALYAAAGATLLGFFAGILAGYFGKLEAAIGGATDVVMAFPALPLLILLGTIFLGHTDLTGIFLILILWAPVARSVRAQVSSVKSLTYVDAARTSGLNDRQIVMKIILFEVGSIGIAYFIINLALGIVIVTALEFLGVGNPLVVSWGSILYWAQQYAFNLGDWWWILAPGFIITLTATAFALIGFSVEEILNPRIRSQG